MHLGIDSTSLGTLWELTPLFQKKKNPIIWCFDDDGGERRLTRQPRISHRCSMGLSSGERGGHRI